jgi:ABC-2 type transport system ATP-binding protein
VRDAIFELQRDERTFLITTHNLSEAQALANRIAIIRHGRIIANGDFDELARRFVGDPRMEMRVRGQLNGLAKEIGDMVNVEDSGENWLRFTVADPNATNPALIQRVMGLGVEIVTLAPLSQTLEDIYLQVVKEDEAQKGDPDEHLR